MKPARPAMFLLWLLSPLLSASELVVPLGLQGVRLTDVRDSRTLPTNNLDYSQLLIRLDARNGTGVVFWTVEHARFRCA
jgi:hypothetical protein